MLDVDIVCSRQEGCRHASISIDFCVSLKATLAPRRPILYASLMRVSGFTIVRNAIKFDYPVAESIRSILPMVDEMIVAVGDCCDDTRDLIMSIGSPKIRVIDTVWDEQLREGGLILSQQTNVALDACSGDWCFYLQADEVIHENDWDRIADAMKRFRDRRRVEGLSFRYHHFRADYGIRDPLPYRRQIRIVRSGIGVRSVGDACGFGVNGRKLRSRSTGAWVYHYGWVKPPKRMRAKMRFFASLYGGQFVRPQDVPMEEDFEWRFDTCEPFIGSHPKVMTDRIANKDWVTPPIQLTSSWYNPKYWRGLVHKNTRTLRRWCRHVSNRQAA
jgi:glycosyltransferase involved in cell wall biosynthesis